MSTTCHGDAFARKVHEYLRQLIDTGQFLAPAERCKLFWKKGYYSRDRDSDIIVDISIEMYLPGADQLSFLYLIECKRLGRALSVDDVEELYAKLDQLADANGKGVVVSASALQTSALAYCRSKGIGVLRYYDHGEFKWELYRNDSSAGRTEPADVAKGLTTMSHHSRGNPFYGGSPTRFTHRLQELFHDLVPDDVRERFKPPPMPAPSRAIPRVSDRNIEAQVGGLLAAINYRDGPVPLAQICEREQQGGRLILYDAALRPTDDEAIGVLGRVRFGTPTEITIFDVPGQKLGRARFTLAHELGHYVLGHGRYMSAEFCDDGDIDMHPSASVPGLADVRRMELQANRFASRLLLPSEAFKASFDEAMIALDLRDRGHGRLFIDDQECNRENFYNATTLLKQRYRVSRQVVEFRLAGMGLLVDRRPHSWQKIGRARLDE